MLCERTCRSTAVLWFVGNARSDLVSVPVAIIFSVQQQFNRDEPNARTSWRQPWRTVGTWLTVIAGFSAVACAPIASATPSGTPVLSGEYRETEILGDGQRNTLVWSITPCGRGCATAAEHGFGTIGLNLVDDKWVADTTVNTQCSDGSMAWNAGTSHYEIDAVGVGNVQMGEARTHWKAVCGNDSTDDRRAVMLIRMTPGTP